MNDSSKQEGRPGDGILAEHDRRAALTNQYMEAGEMTSVNPSPARGENADWRARAACRDVDPELFFPTAAAGAALVAEERRALAVCAGCPVLAACRMWAVAEQPHGIAGGLTEAQRAELRRTRAGVPARPGGPVVRRSVGSLMGRGHRASQSREDGRAALASGTERGRMARECGVSRRTVDCWAAASGGAPTTTTVAAIGGDR